MQISDAAERYGIATRKFRWKGHDLLSLYFLAAVWIIALLILPNALWQPRLNRVVLLIGIMSAWRYSWLVLNVCRAAYFGKVKFPKMRRSADQLWDSGWRPNHIHFMVTTYHEQPFTTEKHLQSIISELTHLNADREENPAYPPIQGTIWLGVGARYDEEVIEQWMETAHCPYLDVVIVRQNQPGKRAAIALILRALSRRGVHPDDIAFMMDGDSILGNGAIQKCASIFGAYPTIKALTTDEDVICEGPSWVKEFLSMRFAQRRLWMQSHAVSDRVLTLTGRMSGFRATSLIEKEFIRMVEADHLNHWLWGSFRFLSGDDKSTWYALLKQEARMTYVPDAIVYTIEHIKGNGVKRMRDNLKRWSGNMLRNGLRAIMLGPRCTGIYIWICLIDQRVSIWTVLAGFSTAILISLFVTPTFIITYLLWIIFSRLLMSVAIYFYSDRIHVSYPFMLYIAQITVAMLKVYMMFRLPQQQWVNRMNQRMGDDVMNKPGLRLTALYINWFYIILMLTIVMMGTGILKMPDGLGVWSAIHW